MSCPDYFKKVPFFFYFGFFFYFLILYFFFKFLLVSTYSRGPNDEQLLFKLDKKLRMLSENLNHRYDYIKHKYLDTEFSLKFYFGPKVVEFELTKEMLRHNSLYV